MKKKLFKLNNILNKKKNEIKKIFLNIENFEFNQNRFIKKQQNHKFCLFTGRARFVYKKLGMTRHYIKNAYKERMLPQVKKFSW